MGYRASAFSQKEVKKVRKRAFSGVDAAAKRV
jgi:hypothetical protein